MAFGRCAITTVCVCVRADPIRLQHNIIGPCVSKLYHTNMTAIWEHNSPAHRSKKSSARNFKWNRKIIYVRAIKNENGPWTMSSIQHSKKRGKFIQSDKRKDLKKNEQMNKKKKQKNFTFQDTTGKKLIQVTEKKKSPRFWIIFCYIVLWIFNEITVSFFFSHLVAFQLRLTQSSRSIFRSPRLNIRKSLFFCFIDKEYKFIVHISWL